MKSAVTFILIFTLFFVKVYAQRNKDITLTHSIKEVALYLNGAEMRSNETISLKKGETKIIITGISPFMRDESVQVAARESTEIISVTTRDTKTDLEKLSSEALQMRQGIRKTEAKLKVMMSQIDAFESEKKMLAANQYIGSQQAGVSLVELAKAADFFRERVLKVNTSLLKMNEEVSTLNHTLDSLKLALDEQKRNSNVQRKEVIVLLNSLVEQNTSIRLRYVVDNASWEPAYDIIATDVTKPVKLKYKANIFNETAIDWENVKITLSTADPSVSASRPVLTAWTLNYSSQGNEGFLQNRFANNVMVDSVRREVKEISVDELSAAFEIPKTYSIVSSSDSYTIEILNETLNATYQYLAIPKVEASAFLIAKVTGWKKLNLIEGTANMYFGNTYIGTSEINTRQLSDTLELSFGRDNQIIVSRAKLEDTAGEKFIGGKRTESLTYQISLKNNRKTPISIKIQDQIPVSQEADIVVEPSEISGATADNLSGRLQWIKTLNPDQGVKLTVAFSVKYPRNKKVVVRRDRSIRTPRYRK